MTVKCLELPNAEKIRIFLGKLLQILISVCGLSLCLSYGLMFGWPCHYFAATFRNPEAFIDIPFATSPLLAGFLMYGNIAGTILAYFARPNAKYAMVAGGAAMTVGWAALWQCQTIHWFFASRLSIGFGQGISYFNLKSYIENICDSNLSAILSKYMNITIFLGILVSVIIAPSLDIPTYGLYSGIVALISVVLCLILPQTPRDLYRFGEIKQARFLTSLLNPNRKLDEDVAILNTQNTEVVWTDLLTKSDLRTKLITLIIATFLQQFTGMPATILFGEFIFEKFDVRNPEMVTICYVALLVIIYTYSVFNMTNNNKLCVIVSTFLVWISLVTLIILLHTDIAKTYPSLFIVCMYLYIIFHTFGLGTHTGPICAEMFPPIYKNIATYFFTIFNAMFAILVGKTFQVLYDQFQLLGPFVLFASVAAISVLFSWIFISEFKVNNTSTSNANTSVTY